MDVKIPRLPRPYGQDDYGACQRQAPTGQIRHHRPVLGRCRTVVKDDGRDWCHDKIFFSAWARSKDSVFRSAEYGNVALKTSVTVAFSPHLRLPTLRSIGIILLAHFGFLIPVGNIHDVKEALQNPISERWGKQICLN